MRILNALAALSGLAALALLVVSSHHMQDATPAEIENLRLASFVQLISAAACLAIANRDGRLNLIGGLLVIAGAALFSSGVATHVLAHTTALLLLAPIGGTAMMLGWLTLAFAKPRA